MPTLRCVLISSPANLGYKFVAEGIIDFISTILAHEDIEFTIVSKHASDGIVQHFEAARRAITTADIVILAGGPILWPFVSRSDWGSWLGPAIIDAALAGTSVAGIALGSCYGLGEGDAIQPCRDEDLEFIVPIIKSCSLLTVRDRPTQETLAQVGISSELLPCVAYRGTLKSRTSAETGGAEFLINHIRGGGLHDYFEITSEQLWARMTRQIITDLRHEYHLRFLCHSVEEYELAPIVDAALPASLATTTAEFVAFASNSIGALNNRIHASIGLAGLGIPSLTVGSDSRIFSLEPFGLPVLGLPGLDYRMLKSALSNFFANIETVKTDLNSGLARATEKYQTLFRDFLHPFGAEPPELVN
jgi:hypothetical protein